MLRKFLYQYVLVIFICFILAIIPFFWLKPGEMDLGGDSGRLYFYDPIGFLKNNDLYYILIQGKGSVEPHFFELPYVFLLASLKTIIPSSYFIISIFNSIKLVGGFLGIYFILKELIDEKKKYTVFAELSAMLGGLLYIFAPNIFWQWDKALIVHNQVFLNPIIFYLVLRFVLTNKFVYLWVVLLLTFIFAPNFSWIAAPTLFSFYPLALLFLGLYMVFILKRKIPFKGIFFAFLVFLSLHAFHLIPELVNILDTTSSLNSRVFNPSVVKQQLDVFYGILNLNKISATLFLSSVAQANPLPFISLAPFIIILGLLFNKRKDKVLLLVGLFFLIVLFFLTAKITYISIKFYALLFTYVPGFSMFRIFNIQWLFAFAFFYALFVGLAYFNISQKLSRKFSITLFIAAVILLLIIDLPFIKGEFFKQTYTAKGERTPIVFDASFIQTLSFIRSIPTSSKLLSLPFTDANFIVIKGANNGTYVGVSPIFQLTGKSTFSGYFDTEPFSNVFWKLVADKDYDGVVRLLSILDIHYLFYNNDKKIYDTEFFPTYPYSTMREYFPKNQKEYQEFVKNIVDKEIFRRGAYSIYTVKDVARLPHVFAAKSLSSYADTVDDWYGKTTSFFVGEKNVDISATYIEKEICEKLYSQKLCKSSIVYKKPPKIFFEQINPVKYKIHVSDAQDSYLLVFSEAFHPNWKLFLSNEKDLKETWVQTYLQGNVVEGRVKSIFFDKNLLETFGKNPIANKTHVLINGYANGWKITPADVGSIQNYTLVLELQEQKTFYIGGVISCIAFVGFMFWGVYIWKKKQ